MYDNKIEIPTEEIVDIDLLKIDSDNPNLMTKEERSALKISMEKYGFIIPIITNMDYIIADGQQRYEVAKDLGITKIKVIRLNLKDVDRRILRQVLNKLKGSHQEDLDLLEYDKILADSGLESLKTMLPDLDIDKILTQLEKKDLGEEDFEVDLDKEPKYKVSLGQIWQLGEHRLVCGDATKKEDVDKLMNGAMAVLMVTDPPYGVNYNPKWRDEADKKGILGNRYPTRALGKVYNDNIIDWRETYELFDCDVVYNWHASWFTSNVQLALESCNYKIIASIIWVKPHFALSQGDYHWKHEPCWYAVKKGKLHNWQGSRTESTVWEIAGMNAMGSSQDKADESTGHGTQKPIECMQRPILNNSKIKEIICDPFGGSGTTLIACEKLGRKCYMMEIDPTYCSVIIERWEKFTGKNGVKLNG